MSVELITAADILPGAAFDNGTTILKIVSITPNGRIKYEYRVTDSDSSWTSVLSGSNATGLAQAFNAGGWCKLYAPAPDMAVPEGL